LSYLSGAKIRRIFGILLKAETLPQHLQISVSGCCNIATGAEIQYDVCPAPVCCSYLT